MQKNDVRRALRSAAGLTALALVAGGMLLPTAAQADDTAATCSANPMGAATPVGSQSGYTIFTTGDAILANSELEGTLAVGGTATFGDPRGNGNLQYPIFHGGVGGNVDYAVPMIDGAPNRVLIGAFAGTKVVQVQERTPNVPAAGAKIADRAQPAGYIFGSQFGGAGTTFRPETGGNMSPQLESQSQLWADGAGAATFVPERATVAEYFVPDEAAALLAQEGIWKTPVIVHGGETSVALDPTGPNRVTLRELVGDSPWPAPKFTLSGYSETAPLIVRVSASDLIDGRLTLPSFNVAGKEAPRNAGISHILWDLSAISGDVVVTSFDEPVRGAIYAPDAHIVFPSEADGGKEFEGQLIARAFTALQGGKEMHTNLFLATLPCVTDPGEEPGPGEPGGENPGGETPGGENPETPGTDEPGGESPEMPGTDTPVELPLTEPDAAQHLARTGGTLPVGLVVAGAGVLAGGAILLIAAARRRSARTQPR